MAALILVATAPQFAVARQSLVLPTLQSISPNKVTLGTTVTAVINGSDLAGATSVQVGGSGITASIVSNTSSSALTVSLSISQGASTGFRSITVVTPAGMSRACDLCLTVFIGGRWTEAGTMSTPRIYHTATLLNDGRVLVVGGVYNGHYLDSADLYDPVTKSWTPTGSLGAARSYHTATLLPNGKVLVIGGYSGPGVLASAEVYDPPNGQWSPAGFMNIQRAGHTAALLPNGMILLAGGGEPCCGSGTTASELYNPATGQSTNTAPMNRGRSGNSAILLSNGSVLVTGIYFDNTAELYDPTTSRWTMTGSIINPPNNPAVLLPTINKVLLPPSSLYDPITGLWSATGSPIINRLGTVSTVLRNGKVLMVGACCDNPTPLVRDTSAELYDPALGVWYLTAPTSVPHRGHTSTLLNDGTVLVAGGGLNLAEVYYPEEPSFQNPAPTVERIDPARALSGSSPVTVTLVGSNFLNGSQVLVGQTVLPATFISSTTITTVIPASLLAITGTLNLVVQNLSPGGGKSAPVGFLVVPLPPTITGVDPRPRLPGTTFTMGVGGTNLIEVTAAVFSGSGVTATIGYVTLEFARSPSLVLTVTVAADAEPGPRTLTITTTGGTSAPFPAFTVLPAISPLPPPSPQPTSPPNRISEVEDGSVQTGYLVITPDQNTSAPFTTLRYGTLRNGIVQDQANVVPLGVTTGATLFIDFLNSASRNVGLVIVNPGGTTNAITITLKNNDGTTASTTTVNIDPYKQLAKFVNELFPDDVGTAFIGSINVQSGSPFAVLGFPFAGTNFSTLGAANTGTLTGGPTRILPAGSGSAGSIGGANAILPPQFVIGGGWATQVALVNTSGTAATGRIDVFDTNGQPKAVKLNGDTRSTFTYSIPAGGTFVLSPRDGNGQTPM